MYYYVLLYHMSKAKIIIKARLILESKGMILLLKQTNQNGGKYTLVGGTVEKMEFAKEALIRESKEEAGLLLQKKDLELVHALHKKRAKDTRIILYFKTKKWSGEIKAKERDKFKKVSWFPIELLPKSTSDTVKYVLKHYRNNIKYSEYPRPKE